MIVRIVRDFRFEAAHYLPKVPVGHKCARMHGHSYTVTVTVEGPIDDELGWVMDFGELDTVVGPVIDSLDHRVLNEVEGLGNPTSELLAVWLWQRIRALPHVVEVAVSETPSSRAVYRGPK